jgi:two-component system sensor kinase FixL
MLDTLRGKLARAFALLLVLQAGLTLAAFADGWRAPLAWGSLLALAAAGTAWAAQRRLDREPRSNRALRESETRSQALLDSAVDAMITIDERGLIQTFNPAAERMFGYAVGEVIGKNVALLMPAPYRDQHDGYIANYLATGRRKIIGIGREVVGQRKDGSLFPAELSVAEARHGDWRVFVGTIRDLTERRQALADIEGMNDELRAMTQQLWQAAKLASVGELAASIAHELNNPLATISLRIESVLRRTPADDPRRAGGQAHGRPGG